MFEDHRYLSAPDGSSTLWRYLDFPSLLSLLEYRALWFARLDTLNDPYEGLPTKPVIDDLWNIPAGLSADELEQRRRTAEYYTQAFSSGRRALFVSCWHLNDFESTAMWNLYAHSGEGVAIKTTFDRLRASFDHTQLAVHGGLVHYVDFASYRPSTYNILDWATLKGMSFKYEHEFRAIVMDTSKDPGILVPTDVDTLLAEIYVSPTSPSWHLDLLKKLRARHSLKAEVQQSQLLQHPAYLQPRVSDKGAG